MWEPIDYFTAFAERMPGGACDGGWTFAGHVRHEGRPDRCELRNTVLREGVPLRNIPEK
jgi:hypothetical protein